MPSTRPVLAAVSPLEDKEHQGDLRRSVVAAMQKITTTSNKTTIIR